MRQVATEVFAWALVVAIILLLLAAVGCQTSKLAKVASTLETGYSYGRGDLDSTRGSTWGAEEDSWAAWVSIRPLAALEPPQPFYEVPPPELQYLSFQSPFASTQDPEVVKPWWYRLDEVRGLLLWIGAGILAGITALLAKLGLDKRKR